MTLRQARQQKGWTQEELENATTALAAKDPTTFATVDQRSISKIERGGVPDPRNRTVTTLETALEIARGTLVFGRQEAIAS